MNSSAQRTPKTGRQSLFFQDLATPVSARRGKFSSPGQAAAFSSMWKDGSSKTDLPPPPVFTLDDRLDFSPEPGVTDFPLSPETKSGSKTMSTLDFSPTPSKSKWSDASTSYSLSKLQKNNLGSMGSNWWSSPKNGSGDNREVREIGSPVEGIVQPGSIITLSPPKEVNWPELPRKMFSSGNQDEEEWVTVYGFSPGDTNLVLREFEKCGIILKHIPGPKNANWMHILYQNGADATRAMGKNGIQVNGVLIVGVKRLDPSFIPCLNERTENRGFMTLPPPARVLALRYPDPDPNLNPNQKTDRVSGGSGERDGRKKPTTALASPTRSLSAKVMDLLFGV